ncbi:MAG: hypothetical protein ACXWNJ_00820 [Vulcanimicrobiaceae bacterium]
MVARLAPKSVSLLASCSLARPAAGGCAWCGTELPQRRRTWCSDRCGTAFWNNHWWTLARRAAKRRDKYRCKRCGHALPKRPSRSTCSSEKAYRAAMRAWRTQRRTGRLEVNHRDPCRGQHGQLSCAHHLENLETLCVTCHKAHTSAIPRRRTTGAIT